MLGAPMVSAPVTSVRRLAGRSRAGSPVGRWAVGAACPSPESRYSRFVNGASKLSKPSVRYLTDLSHRHRRGRSRPDRLVRGLSGQASLAALRVLGTGRLPTGCRAPREQSPTRARATPREHSHRSGLTVACRREAPLREI